MFRDRTDAGDRLAASLRDHDISADLVLAIPRGGLPVGRAVADELSLPLDVVVARKLGAPSNPELALGAVASDGSSWLNTSLIDRLGVSDEYVERRHDAEATAARDKLERYRRGRPPLELTGRTVVVVDDGVATGATTIACLRQVRAADVARVVLAVPVAPPETLTRLTEEADDVVCVETPRWFTAVGAYYDDFTQVADDEARALLDG